MFGWLMYRAAASAAKLLLERHSEDNVTDNYRHLEQLRLQLAEAKRERDEIDAELPASSGSLDARLREAEIELRDLERLIPVRTEREQAEQRHQAAQRRLAAAQDAVKDARHRWKNALRSVGLPEDFAPPKVKQVVKSNERRAGPASPPRRPQGRARPARARDARRQQSHPADSGRRAASVRRATSRSSGFASWFRPSRRRRKRSTLREDVEKKLRHLVARIARQGRSRCCARPSRSRHALLTLAGVERREGLPPGRGRLRARVADLKRQHAEQTIRIQTHAGRRNSPKRRSPRSSRPKAATSRPAGTSGRQQLADIRARLAQMHERRGACTHEMQSLAADRQTSPADAAELGKVEAQLTDVDPPLEGADRSSARLLGDRSQAVRNRSPAGNAARGVAVSASG